MRKCLFLQFIFFILFFSGSLFSQDEDVPEGMEVIEVGGAKALVPQGMKVKIEKKGLIIMEDTQQYIARRFLEIENRLATLNQKQAQLEEELNKLRLILEKVKEEYKRREELDIKE